MAFQSILPLHASGKSFMISSIWITGSEESIFKWCMEGKRCFSSSFNQPCQMCHINFDQHIRSLRTGRRRVTHWGGFLINSSSSCSSLLRSTFPTLCASATPNCKKTSRMRQENYQEDMTGVKKQIKLKQQHQLGTTWLENLAGMESHNSGDRMHDYDLQLVGLFSGASTVVLSAFSYSAILYPEIKYIHQLWWWAVVIWCCYWYYSTIHSPSVGDDKSYGFIFKVIPPTSLPLFHLLVCVPWKPRIAP